MFYGQSNVFNAAAGTSWMHFAFMQLKPNKVNQHHYIYIHAFGRCFYLKWLALLRVYMCSVHAFEPMTCVSTGDTALIGWACAWNQSGARWGKRSVFPCGDRRAAGFALWGRDVQTGAVPPRGVSHGCSQGPIHDQNLPSECGQTGQDLSGHPERWLYSICKAWHEKVIFFLNRGVVLGMFCIIFDILVFWGAYNMIQWEYGGQTAQFYSETQTEHKKKCILSQMLIIIWTKSMQFWCL